MNNFVSDYCRMARLGLVGYELLTQTISSSPSHQRKSLVQALLGPIESIRSDLLRVESLLVDEVQTVCAEMLGTTHEMVSSIGSMLDEEDVQEGVIKENLSRLPSEILASLKEDEEKALAVITVAFRPVHDQVNRLIGTLRAV